jgi:Chitobiase/beta-hexosaminidase C-terminal domain
MTYVYDAAGNVIEAIRIRAASKIGKFFSLHGGVPRYAHFVMEKITLSFVALTAITAMMIAQGCVSKAGTAATRCAKPSLTPSDATSATTSVTVKIATKTPGAYLRYTLDGSTPTGGPSGNGKEIQAASGKILIAVGWREKTLKAIAYKPGLADSEIAEANYSYQSPY